MAPLNVDAKQTLLKEILNELPAGHKSIDFYTSLYEWYADKGFWTIKQEKYVDEAINLHTKTSAEIHNETQIEKPPVSELFFDARKIRKLFDLAATKIKYPSIHFWRDIGEIQFYLCGINSRTPGFIRITNSQKYPNQETYAEINQAGKGLFRKDTSARFKEEIQAICAKPVEEAKVRGIKTGYCCFCCTPIQTKESLAAGYGPICAGNYGLPWGEAPSSPQKELVNI